MNAPEETHQAGNKNDQPESIAIAAYSCPNVNKIAARARTGK
jgi:hypothetical protein